MNKEFNLFSYITWLVISTLLLLCVVIAIDMFFAYRELRGPVLEQATNTNESSTEKKTGFHIAHEKLGWVVNKNSRTVHRVAGNFDVTYNSDARGFRKTPARPDAERTIYFFGDSFTFGHGVEDFETFASVISLVWLDDRIEIINVGANGYGLTQMYGRFLELEDQLQKGDLLIFSPISKDLVRSFKDFAVPAQYLFRPAVGNAKMEYYPYFDNGDIKRGKLDTLINRFKGLLFHAPLTGNAMRKIYRLMIGPVDFDDADAMFELVKSKSAGKGASFYLYFLPQVKDLIRGRYKYDVSRYDYLDIWSYFPAADVAKEIIGFPDDGHWNCHGHEIAAYAIVTTLIENDALDKKYLRRSLENMPELCMQKNAN